MSEYDLIPDEVYENLPQDPHDKFAALVRVAQTNLARMLDDSGSGDFCTELRAQFMSTISGIAEALDIEGLPPLDDNLTEYAQYTKFQVYLAGVVARVRLQGHLVARPHSVELERVTRARIHQEIEQLRRSIDESDLPDKKKEALRARLDDLQAEVTKTRVSFARLMAITAAIMVTVGEGTNFLANAPGAAGTIIRIIQWVGEDKEKEEANRLRLMPPPKALPDFTKDKTKSKPAPVFDTDLDDDVPF